MVVSCLQVFESQNLGRHVFTASKKLHAVKPNLLNPLWTWHIRGRRLVFARKLGESRAGAKANLAQVQVAIGEGHVGSLNVT